MPRPETFHSSLRKCDLYDNPYNPQMQVHPAIVKQRKEMISERDSISSVHKKMESQLLEAFKQHSSQFLSGKLIFVAMAGKYAFLAIMLPTYLFFYGIPKWLLTELAPAIYDFSKRIVVHAGSKIGSAVSHVATAAFKIVRTVTDPILNFIQTRVEKGRELYQRIKQPIVVKMRSVTTVAALLFRKLSQKGMHAFVNLLKPLKKTMTALAITLTAFPAKIRKPFSKLSTNVQEKIQSISLQTKTLTEKLVQVFIPVGVLLSKIKPLFSKAAALVERPARLARRAIAATKNRLQEMTRPLIEWVKPQLQRAHPWIERAKERLENVKNSVTAPIRRLMDETGEFVEKKFEQLEVVKQNVLQILPQPVIAFFTPLMQFFNQMARAPRQLSRGKQSVKRKMIKLRERLRVKWLYFRQRFVPFFKKIYRLSKPKLIGLIKRCAKALALFLVLLKEMLKGAFYMLLLILAWVRVLFRQGMIAVREACVLPQLKNKLDFRP